jgi:hypothetical protein
MKHLGQERRTVRHKSVLELLDWVEVRRIRRSRKSRLCSFVRRLMTFLVQPHLDRVRLIVDS